jgi:hypothetical protein
MPAVSASPTGFESGLRTHEAAEGLEISRARTPSGTTERECRPDDTRVGARPLASDPVEAALAEALRGATVASRWDLVSQLATELETRRRTRDASVVRLEAECSKGTS